MKPSPEFSSSDVPHSVLETEQRHREALTTVLRMSRMAGRELPISAVEGEVFPQEPGIYLFDHEADEAGEIQDASFVMERRRLSGAADSAHAVISGRLKIDRNSKPGKEIEIAAKCYRKRPYAERLARAQNEVNFSLMLLREGELAMVPEGVAISAPELGREPDVVLFTQWDDDLLTLDNAPWGRGLTYANLGDAVRGADALGGFNAKGRWHKDAKVKNIATNNKTGQVGMIDFETSVLFDPNDSLEAAAAASSDFGLYLKSLKDKGLFKERTTNYTTNAEQIVGAMQTIAEGYLQNWEEASLVVQEAVYTEVLGAIERLKDETLSAPQLVTV